MPSFTLNIPSAQRAQKIVDAFAFVKGWQEVGESGLDADGLSKTAFAKKQIREFVLNIEKSYDANVAKDAAIQAAIAAVDAEQSSSPIDVT